MNNHLIELPIDLIKQWSNSQIPGGSAILIANRAAQWGADQELEACLEWLDKQYGVFASSGLRTARRPKPPSLKEQGLDAIDNIERYGLPYIEESIKTVRQALEVLPND